MIGKWILIIGVVPAALGGVIWLIESLGVPLGRLPGDNRQARTVTSTCSRRTNDGFHCIVDVCLSMSP